MLRHLLLLVDSDAWGKIASCRAKIRVELSGQRRFHVKKGIAA
jgi:hypothetical protein